MPDDLAQHVPIVEVHLVVDGIIDWVVVIGLEFHISPVFELRQFVGPK